MAFYCYILECTNGAFYTGWSTDPARRLRTHNRGKGARYTRLNGPVRLVYVEELPDHTSVLKREAEIKGWTHSQKKKLIELSTNNISTRFMNINDKTYHSVTLNSFTVIAPGRVNLLGEHIDYNDGIVLPAAIDREIRIKVSELSEPIVRIQALDLGESVEFSLRDLRKKTDLKGQPLPSFGLYAAGVASKLLETGLELRGLEAILSSTIPIGAGLSSSAAVEVGFALAWKKLGSWEVPDMDLIKLCQKAEVEYVGVNSGLMDQFASYFGVEGHALMFDTRNLDWQPIRLPDDLAIVIADSGIRRNLTDSSYNDRRKDCETAVRLLNSWLPGTTSLRDVSSQQLASLISKLPKTIGKRAKHVVAEIERVKQAVGFLNVGNGREFGRLMFASHASLRDLYEVSCPELDLLVDTAAKIEGCYGSKLTGAGFGGCTVNLVSNENADAFIGKLTTKFRQDTGKELTAHLCHATRGAHYV